jgi:hypothetical protein
LDRCIDCQICVSNRWTDKIQSKFEGKIWSRKSIFRELVDCQHSYFIWVIGSKFNYAIKKIKTGFCFLSWTNDFLFGFFMGLDLVFTATFNNISVLLLKETRAPRENHWLVTISQIGSRGPAWSGDVYSIQHYVIMFVSDLWQVSGFLWVLWFPSAIKLKYCWKWL